MLLPDPDPKLEGKLREDEIARLNALAARRVVQLVEFGIPHWLGFDPIDDIQVLAPNRRTEIGVDALNPALQDALNPLLPGRRSVRLGGTEWREGDKVMQRVNDYDKEVYNGDVGRIRRIDFEARDVVIEFYGEERTYAFGEMSDVADARITKLRELLLAAAMPRASNGTHGPPIADAQLPLILSEGYGREVDR